MFPLFPLGQIVATPGALAALERAKQPPACFVTRHAIGDWGELEPTDMAENEYSVAHGFRLLSSYQTDAGERLRIITEADRSACSARRCRLPVLFTSPFPHGAPLVFFKATWKFPTELIFNNRSNVAHRCYSQIPSTESTFAVMD